jgi:uncharacterized protein with von Willebrand factor type A (vWA) domain
LIDTLLAFDARQIESRLSPLEELGRSLWLPAIINSEGVLVERLRGLLELRDALLRGVIPWHCNDPDEAERQDAGAPWPQQDVQRVFGETMTRLGLPRLCERQAQATEQVMRSLLWYLDQLAGLGTRVGRADALTYLAQRFHDDWDAQRRDWEEVLRVLESLDGVAHFARSSALRGLLRSQAWQSLLQAHELIVGMPHLRALIHSLGRSRPDQNIERRPHPRSDKDARERQWVERWHDRLLPGVATEVEGIRRAGDINRLLASELMQWRRRLPDAPDRMQTLRRLFAARLTEQSLLSLEHHEHVQEWERVEDYQKTDQSNPEHQARLEAGPIIICLDTSASMAGGPERVTKAIALEVMRTASRENRPCHLLAFSGPGELRDTPLPMDEEGLVRLAEFVAAGFHGGTDIVEPIESALNRICQSDWRQADLLIASDGEFGVTPATHQRLSFAKAELGLRVQGVLIGDRETIGLREVCDHVFWVQDWRRYGAEYGQVESPVHDKSLTKLYFPSASMRPPG